jgi:hypothetical protein
MPHPGSSRFALTKPKRVINIMGIIPLIVAMRA